MTDSLPGGIPRVIHRIWLGPRVPPRVASLGEAWRRLHPDWECHLWRDWNLPAFRHQERFDQAPSPAGKADIARLDLLYRCGGVYVDTDFEPRRPLDDLIASVGCFAATEDGRWVSTGIVGCAPRHPFIAALLDGLDASIRANPGAPPNVQTGPKYVTGVYEAYAADPSNPPVALFPAALFYPYHFTEPERSGEDFPEAFAVHHWDSTWTHE